MRLLVVVSLVFFCSRLKFFSLVHLSLHLLSCVAVGVNRVSPPLSEPTQMKETDESALLFLHLPLSSRSHNETLHQTLSVRRSLSFITASLFLSLSLIHPRHFRFFSSLCKSSVRILPLSHAALVLLRGQRRMENGGRTKDQAQHFTYALCFHREAHYFLLCLSVCQKKKPVAPRCESSVVFLRLLRSCWNHLISNCWMFYHLQLRLAVDLESFISIQALKSRRSSNTVPLENNKDLHF